MISIVKKKNNIERELLSKIEWACSLNAIKLGKNKPKEMPSSIASLSNYMTFAEL